MSDALEVFLVEDDQAQITLIKIHLRQNSGTAYSVTEARNLKVALNMLADTSYKPDIILLDLNLPGSEGINTYRAIRLSRPETPVLILTNYFSTDLAREALKEGAGGFALKAGMSAITLGLQITTAIQATKNLVLERQIREISRKGEEAQTASLKRLPIIIIACASCRKVKDVARNEWVALEVYLERYGVALSHTSCDSCMPGLVDQAINQGGNG